MSDPRSRAKLARQQARLNAALPLILLTDDLQPGDWALSAQALPREAIVILRARHDAARAALAATLAPAVRARGLRLVIADDPMLALRVGAAGLHLPQRRAREASHWRARRPDWIITTTAHSLSALVRVQATDVDAVLLSPVFPTASHAGAKGLTPVRAAFIAAAARVQVYALGGVTARNAALLSLGFDGIAAIGALSIL